MPALGTAVEWGILSIVPSPCHLASNPLIVGLISEQGPVITRRPCWTSTLFVVGILVIGAVSVLAGTSTEVEQKVFNWNENSKAVTGIKGAYGVLVVSGGIWMIYTAP